MENLMWIRLVIGVFLGSALLAGGDIHGTIII